MVRGWGSRGGCELFCPGVQSTLSRCGLIYSSDPSLRTLCKSQMTHWALELACIVDLDLTQATQIGSKLRVHPIFHDGCLLEHGILHTIRTAQLWTGPTIILLPAKPWSSLSSGSALCAFVAYCSAGTRLCLGCGRVEVRWQWAFELAVLCSAGRVRCCRSLRVQWIGMRCPRASP